MTSPSTDDVEYPAVGGEDDRYGPPSHTCEYCSRCFPATWEEKDGKTRLVVDMLRSLAEATLAAESGCHIFGQLKNSHDIPEALQGKLVIEKKWNELESGGFEYYLITEMGRFNTFLVYPAHGKRGYPSATSDP